jgi:hypothetical protein
MNRSIALLAVFAALSTAACAGSSDEGAGSSANAATVAAHGHHDQVVACEKANAKAGETAGSTMEMVQMEAEFADCLEKANDAAVPVIESLLKANESSTVGGVKAALDSARKANGTLCEELHKASMNFGGTLQRVEDAGCAAEREHFLAAIIDDMVAFDGVEPTYLKDDRAAHAACYKAYDAVDAQSTMEMVGVNADLADCVRKEMSPMLDAMASSEVENDASYGPLATAKTRVAAAFDGQIESADGFCGAIAEAGENGIGTLTRVSSAACRARVTEAAFTTLKDNSPGEP